MSLTKADRINTVFGGGGHVVILGAGASIASTIRNPELSGKKLPSMDNFIEVVGLQDIVDSLDDRLRAQNFELLYSNLHENKPESDEIKEIVTNNWEKKKAREAEELAALEAEIAALRSNKPGVKIDENVEKIVTKKNRREISLH